MQYGRESAAGPQGYSWTLGEHTRGVGVGGGVQTLIDIPLPPATTGHPQVWNRKLQVCVLINGPCWGLTGWGAVSLSEPHCASNDSPSGRGVVCTFQRAVSKGPSHSFLPLLKPLEPEEASSLTLEKRFMF